MASDDDDDDDDDDANSKDVEVVKIGTAMTKLERLVNLKDLSTEERNSLVTMKDKLEKISDPDVFHLP